jgi:hypothetical protein
MTVHQLAPAAHMLSVQSGAFLEIMAYARILLSKQFSSFRGGDSGGVCTKDRRVSTGELVHGWKARCCLLCLLQSPLPRSPDGLVAALPASGMSLKVYKADLRL